METKKFIYYQAEEMFIGWLEEFPDYKTQGENLDELKENLKDVHKELTSGRIPNVLHEGCHGYPANDSFSGCGPCAPAASKKEIQARLHHEVDVTRLEVIDVEGVRDVGP